MNSTAMINESAMDSFLPRDNTGPVTVVHCQALTAF